MILEVAAIAGALAADVPPGFVAAIATAGAGALVALVPPGAVRLLGAEAIAGALAVLVPAVIAASVILILLDAAVPNAI